MLSSSLPFSLYICVKVLIMIAIIDYGMGNLRSVQKGFERMGHEAVVTRDAEDDLERIESGPARRGRVPGLHAEPP